MLVESVIYSPFDAELFHSDCVHHASTVYVQQSSSRPNICAHEHHFITINEEGVVQSLSVPNLDGDDDDGHAAHCLINHDRHDYAYAMLTSGTTLSSGRRVVLVPHQCMYLCCHCS